GAAKVSEKIQPSQVVPSGQEDKPQDQNQPKPKSNVLGPLTQRTPQNSFASIVQKMPAVEQWNRKKVGKANAYGKYSRQLKQRQKAENRHLTGHFGDAQGTAKLVGAGIAPHHLHQSIDRGVNDVPGFGAGGAERARQAVIFRRDRSLGRRPHPDHHAGPHIAQHIAHLGGVRHYLNAQGTPLANKVDGERLSSAYRNNLRHLLKIGDARAVYGGDAIPSADTGRLGGAAFHNIADNRGNDGVTIVQDHAGEKNDSQDEIGERTRRRHRGPLPDRLVRERLRTLGLAHVRIRG